MNSIAMEASVAQLRALAASASGAQSVNTPSPSREAFGAILRDSLAAVNGEQTASAAAAEAYLRGDPEVSLAEVMISAEKASLSFEAVNQTRNKLLSAYRDIMNMPL